MMRNKHNISGIIKYPFWQMTAQNPKAGFTYPLQKDKTGKYKIQSGELIRVCMTSE